MENLSNKARIVIAILKQNGATDVDHKTNIFEILNTLEDMDLSTIVPEEDEYELKCIKSEMTQKSVSTTLAALHRKGLINKTEIVTVTVDGENKNLRCYFLGDAAKQERGGA